MPKAHVKLLIAAESRICFSALGFFSDNASHVTSVAGDDYRREAPV